jgi:aspartate aminotransferase
MDSIQRDIIDSTQTAALILEKAPYFPPDIIFSVKTGYLADSHPEKILLSNGIYCDGEGKPWVLPAVRLAEIAIKNAGHEYLPIAGLKEFRERALELIFHGTQALREGRV